MQSKLIGFT